MLRSAKLTTWIFVLSLVLHLLFFNINSAEWGDSYRILRAAEFVREFSYPEDEKRPPLFSILLAMRPEFVDQVTWGRLEMLIISMLTLYIFYRYLNKIFQNDINKINIGVVMLVLNPVYFYWSLRIMADTLFSMFVVLALFILSSIKEKESNLKIVILGFVVGLSILTRFEGYLLFVSLTAGLVFIDGLPRLNAKHFLGQLRMSLKSLILYVGATFITLLPWIIFRNPFTSSYFDEPKSRVYDLNTILIFVLSLLFLFGFTSFFPIILFQISNIWEFLKKNVAIGIFLGLELLLILAWPAAIPRLFVAVIPVFIIIFLQVIEKGFQLSGALAWRAFITNILFIFVLAVGQYFYKLQSLILIKSLFALALGINLLGLFALSQLYFDRSIIHKLLKKIWFLEFRNIWEKVYLSTVVLSMFIWMFATVWIHKDLYKTIKEASIYLMRNAEGNVAHNDVGSVTEWYLDYKEDDNIQGFYYDIHDKKLTYDSLLNNKVDYILATNEHNLGFSISIDKRPYLTQIYESSANINGASFNTRVYRFERHQNE